MITHRMSTQSPESPVKMYKIIALSFLFITILLLGVIIFITAKKAEIVIVAKEDAKKVQLSVTIDKEGKGVMAIPGTVTSTVFAWSEKYQPTGSKRVEGTAKGEATLYNKTGTSQPLVKTTRLQTADGVLFRLATATVVPANGEVTVPVYADKSGSSSDIAPSKFTIPGLPEAKQKVIYAESKAAMSGGSQTVTSLSEEDIKSAEENYKTKVQQAFLKTISQNLLEVEASVVDQSVTASAVPGSEIKEFTVSGTSTLVVVSYNLRDLNTKIAKEVENKVDLTMEKFLAADKKPAVSVANFSLKDGTAELSATQDVLVTLDANVEKLAPHLFVGKREDEIQRYILGLDHVVGVEVKFSPSWISTAPTAADRIRVIVKNVK